jgi:hypothetical protein
MGSNWGVDDAVAVSVTVGEGVKVGICGVEVGIWIVEV